MSANMNSGVMMRWSLEGQQSGRFSTVVVDKTTEFSAVAEGWIRLLVYCAELLDVEESVVEIDVHGRRMVSPPCRRTKDGKHMYQTIFEIPQPSDAQLVTLSVSPPNHQNKNAPARPLGRLSIPASSLDGGMEGGFGLLDEYARPVTASDGKRGVKLFIQGVRNSPTAQARAVPSQSLPQVSRLGLGASLSAQEPYKGPPTGGVAGVKLFLQIEKESVANEASFAASIRSGLAEDVGVPQHRFQYCGMANEPTVPGYPPCSAACFNLVPDQGHSVRPSTNITSEIVLRACDPNGLRQKDWPLSLVRSALPTPPMPSASIQLPQPGPGNDSPAVPSSRFGHPLPAITPAQQELRPVQEVLRQAEASKPLPQAPPPPPQPQAAPTKPQPANPPAPQAEAPIIVATRPPPPPEEAPRPAAVVPFASTSTQTDDPPAPPKPAAPSSSGLRASQVITPPKQSGGDFFHTLASHPKRTALQGQEDPWRVYLSVLESRDVCVDGASGVFCCSSLVNPDMVGEGHVGLRHAPALGSIVDLAHKVGLSNEGVVQIRPMHTSDVSHQDSSPAWKNPADLRLELQSPNELGALSREDVLLLVSVHTVDFWGVENLVGQADMVLKRGQRLDAWVPLQKGKAAAAHPRSGRPCLLHIEASYEAVPPAKGAHSEDGMPQLGSWVVDSVVGGIHSVFGGLMSDAEQQEKADKGPPRAHEDMSVYKKEMQRALARDVNWETFGLNQGGESTDGKVELEVVEGAIVALKALHRAGWEIVALATVQSVEAEAAVRTLREYGVVDMKRGPVLEHNLMFVSHWRQMALVVTRLQGLSAAISPRWSALTSISLAVTGGLHCILSNPTADERALFHEAQLLQAQDEVVLRELLIKLADVYAKMEDVRHQAADAGITVAELESPPGAVESQRGTSVGVERARNVLASSYHSLVQKEIEILRQAQPLVSLGPSPLSVVPRGAADSYAKGETFGEGCRSTWGELCETLGVDRDRLQLYDDRKAMTSGLVASGKMQPPDPRPFFPLREESTKIHPEKLAKLNSSIVRTQPRIGVGVVLESGGQASEGREEWCVASVDPGGHAARSNKIRVGDRVVAVNGRLLLASMTSTYVNGLLQGTPGTAVLLSIVRGALSQELVLLLRSDSQPVPSGSKGRLIVDLASVLRRKRPESANLGTDLVITVKRGESLAESLDREPVFCRVTVSGPPPYFAPQEMITGQSVPKYGTVHWGWVARVPVSVPSRQRVTFELLRPNVSEGSCEGKASVTVADLVADAQQWVQLVGGNGDALPVRNGAGAPALLIQAHMHSAPTTATPPRSSAGGAQRPASAVVELYEDLSGMEERFGGRKNLKNEIGLDIAAALKVNPERVKVVSLRAGSVLARINIMPSALDPRTPSSLVTELRSMIDDKKSALHVAQTTHHAAAVTEVAYDEAEESDEEDAGSTKQRGGADGALWDYGQLRSEETGPEDHTKGDARSFHPITSRRTLDDLSAEERTVASLNALADGSVRSRNPALEKLPAVVSVMVKPDASSMQRTAAQKAAKRLLLRQAIADALFISGNLVHIGGDQGTDQSAVSHAIDVLIANPPEGTKDHGLLKLHDMLRPGVQHQKAAQFVSQVFDPNDSKPLRALNNSTLNRITWAQVIQAPVMEESVRVYDLLAGIVREKTPKEKKAEKMAEREAEAVHVATRVWVADPVLGRVWEEMNLEGGKIWLDHSRKVMSRSHPSFLLPLPDGWMEKLDLQRHIYYVSSDGKTQWEHPLAREVDVLQNSSNELVVPVAVDDVGMLGIEIEEVMNAGDEISTIVVKSVSPGGAGDKSGLVQGDVIVRIDGDTLNGLTADDVSSKIIGVPGETVRLSVLRAPAFVA